MCIVHPFPLEGPAAFACAQAGCRACLDGLMRQHERLVHHVLRRQVCGDAAYDDLLQEGRIGLWQAVLHFDPQRGVAFSTYAGVAIQHRIWHAAKQAGLPDSEPSPADLPDARELAEENVWRADVREALVGAVSRLPERLRQVVCAAYGLDGAPPCTLDAIGQRFGVTGEMARYWRNNGLVLLRLPCFSRRLRQVYGQDSRSAYARSQALTRAWLRGRRRRR
ncbi:MAG: sigma-70 family RNA polymerase sigma factor [Chloroflexi bacterium]|nr:sigma-70 family RNA polymerase sigma factor [Chloroflexota bacterium]